MKALIVHQHSQSILEQFPELASIVSSATSVGGEAIQKSKLISIYQAISKIELTPEHLLHINDREEFEVKVFKYICSLIGIKGCVVDEILKIFDKCCEKSICRKFFGCCL
jgi:hypothetical protein